MQNNNKPIDMKKYVNMANEKRKNDPDHVIVAIIDSMIQSGLIDSEGNIINQPKEEKKIIKK